MNKYCKYCVTYLNKPCGRSDSYLDDNTMVCTMHHHIYAESVKAQEYLRIKSISEQQLSELAGIVQ